VSLWLPDLGYSRATLSPPGLTTMMRLTRFVALAALSLGAAVASAAEDVTVLITGANRGIGLEYARQFEAKGYTVIGTARQPDEAAELKALGVRVEALDVTDAASVAAMAKRLDGVPIDILINNAGIGDRNDASILTTDFALFERTLAVNTLGPLRVTQALLPNLRAGARKHIVNMSSRLGSIALNNGNYAAYRASKAALNQVNRSLSIELGKQGFVVVVVHPGWVRTEMGGAEAPLLADESVRGLVALIDRLSASDNGRFYDYLGAELPW
jgi:NAD(P)-dependent dehydrogenase (short-subunit alcohol dehydrogenase family)